MVTHNLVVLVAVFVQSLVFVEALGNLVVNQNLVVVADIRVVAVVFAQDSMAFVVLVLVEIDRIVAAVGNLVLVD